jgi:hypothetical protein
MFRYFSTTSFSPNGINWGHYADRRVDGLLMQAQQSLHSEQQIELLAQAHAIVVDEAAWAFIVHDQNPRAMSSKVKGFQPAQSWYSGLHQGYCAVSDILKAATGARARCSPLIGMADARHRPLIEMAADDLQRQWQPRVVETVAQ